MASAIRKIAKWGELKAFPAFVSEPNYEVIMGSLAYGVSGDTSDMDIYAFCIPPLDMIFPHRAGYIHGFGKKPQSFHNIQKHHIADRDGKNRTYDISVYGIVSYFDLVMGGNPNMIDSLFVPQRCILHSDKIGNMVRENRHLFLSKNVWHTFKGYAYSQLRKAKNKNPESEKRKESILMHGVDTKRMYHTVRLLLEVEQLLISGDMDMERDRETLKAIREGSMTETDVNDLFVHKERELENHYLSDKCHLPYKPRENEIKALLLNCFEEFFGTLDASLVSRVDEAHTAMLEIKELMMRYGY